MPPNALPESHSKAFKNALEAELLIEAPQGLLCFKITEAKMLLVSSSFSVQPNSKTVESADSRSNKLL